MGDWPEVVVKPSTANINEIDKQDKRIVEGNILGLLSHSKKPTTQTIQPQQQTKMDALNKFF